MSKRILYFNQLDTLRALAVVMTLLVHFLPESGGFVRIPYMHLGVDLFFAISGFLITSILLKTREQNMNKQKIQIIKNFIIRRSLRLFPIYYIFLLSFVLLSIVTGFWVWNKGYGVYYFTYTANVLFYLHDFQSRCFNHIWSLCVEEQFYLLWPWLILFFPYKWLKNVLFICIFIGLFSWTYFYNHNIRMLPFGNFHTLGIGALLAYFYYYHFKSKFFVHFVDNSKLYFTSSIILFVIFLLSLDKFLLHSELLGILYGIRELLLAIVLFFLLLSTIIGWRGYIGIIANNSLIQYIGKISYGVYLYHKPIPTLLNIILQKLQIVINPLFLIAIYVILTFTIAVLSYKYFEAPFLKLKEKFD